VLSDPIVALATPRGRSAVALVRVSGRGAHQVARAVLTPLRTDRPRLAHRARVRHPASGEVLDEVLCVAYAAPASYTGEDAVEVWCHGGLLVPAEVVAAFEAAGARPALPGEFTRRAVLNGKLDLLQAEAIGDLVDATAPAQRRAALRQLDRGTTERVAALREHVLALEALTSYDIDFPEEDDGPVRPGRIAAAAVETRAAIERLRSTMADGLRLRDGAVCVIAGVPNAGKSSLFNALLGQERAIVTEAPGTTRDAIEAPAVCGGFPFRLVDTAGLREGGDHVERLGIEVAWRYVRSADVVLICVEAGRETTPTERAFIDGLSVPALIARTKADLAVGRASPGEVPVSALTGQGIAALRERLAGLAFAGLVGGGEEEPVLTRERHQAALSEAVAEIDAFAEARHAGIDAAVAATHLRAAVTALDGLIGLVTPEDVLARVFSTFCVGK